MIEYFEGRLSRVSHLIIRQLGTDEWLGLPVGNIEETLTFDIYTSKGFTHAVYIGGYVDSTPQLLNKKTKVSIFLRESL